MRLSRVERQNAVQYSSRREQRHHPLRHQHGRCRVNAPTGTPRSIAGDAALRRCPVAALTPVPMLVAHRVMPLFSSTRYRTGLPPFLCGTRQKPYNACNSLQLRNPTPLEPQSISTARSWTQKTERQGYHPHSAAQLRQNPQRLGPSLISAHELSHTCAVWHHGEGDEKKRKCVGRYQEAQSLRVLSKSSRAQRMMAAAFLVFASTNGLSKWIGVPLSQRESKTVTCVIWLSSGASPTGSSSICSRREQRRHPLRHQHGTGVNVPPATGHRPQSRYGDPALNRGNCKGQLCISDAYNGTHNR